jgi:quercetin dioxygenase-like cupin family protein
MRRALRERSMRAMRRTSTCTERPELFRHAGRTVRVLIDGPRTAKTYTVIEVRTSPEAGPPPHVHANEDEHLHVLEGALHVTLGGVEHELGPGDELSLPRDVAHHVRAATAEARYLATCTPSGIESFQRATRENCDGSEINPDDFAAHVAGAGLLPDAGTAGLS